jgi:tetratricopeptide (TPR) repeat protein
MTRVVRSIHLVLFALVCVLPFSLFADDVRTKINVQKYIIDAAINPRTQSIEATAKIDFTPLENANQVTFELNNALTVSKAVDSTGANMPTQRDATDFSVRIMFPSGLVKDKPASISISFDGKLTGREDSPISGITFAALQPDYGYLLYPARWFPVNGYTSNRFMMEMHITTPAEYHVAGSGDLKEAKGKDGGTVSTLIYDKPSFPGSIAIVKSDPEKVSSEGISTQVFFRSDKAGLAHAYGEETGKIISFFTTLYGLAPSSHLTLVETGGDSPVSGYSAPGIIFLSPGAITKATNTKLLSNQLSRQWWGNLVSPANRNHLWLQNGPARLSELLYTEHIAGVSTMEADLRNTYVEAMTVKDPPMLQSSRLEDYSPEYWALTAAKGAAVLNMLRNVVGDENFKKGLHAFMDQYSGKSFLTEDFRKVMERVSNEELRYFFLQWLDSSGSPQFKLEYTVFRTQTGFRVVGKITQDLDTFRMPVDLRVETEGNPEDKKIEVTGTSSEFSVDTFGKPRSLTLDPNHVLLRMDSSMQIAVAIRRGEQFAAINDYQNALREFQKALEVNRNSSLAHYRIGDLFLKQNNYQSAANEFRSAVNGDLDPKWTDVWSHINLGKIFDVTGQRDRAVNEYKLALRTHDNTFGAQEEATRFSAKPYEQKNSEI